MLKSIRELYQYRHLAYYLVSTDLKVRYRGAFLGFLWTLLNPILLTLVLWTVFSRISRGNEESYGLFLLSGMMIWTYFAQCVTDGLRAIIKHRGLIKKIYLPKIIFPVTASLSNLVNFFFFFLAFVLIAIFTTVGIRPTLPLLIPVMVMLFALSTGSALIIGTLNVFFRDFTHLTEVILRALFYLTPVIYPPEFLGPKLEWIMKFNPVYYPVSAGRSVAYYGEVPGWDIWGPGFAISFGVLLVGLFLFNRQQAKFIYYL